VLVINNLNLANQQNKIYQIALGLAIFTIAINIIEGFVSILLGYEGGSLTLFGFGIDSFVEVISGIGIAHMIIRIRQNAYDHKDSFERNALRITGIAFYVLVFTLVVTSIYNIYTHHKPETTFWGVIISLISIGLMWGLMYGKIRVGHELNSRAILADAECTRVCILMSIVLLAASGIYELTKVPFIDSGGALGLAYLSLKEGREYFQKAKSNELCS